MPAWTLERGKYVFLGEDKDEPLEGPKPGDTILDYDFGVKYQIIDTLGNKNFLGNLNKYQSQKGSIGTEKFRTNGLILKCKVF
jgi:hypothetical protein